MDSTFETKKRLEIAKNISSQLEGIVKCVLIGGSMGYGQNFSVTDKSDIDIVVICDKEKINELALTEYFQGEISENILKIFGDGTINLFWVMKIIDSVEVNSFIYETHGFEKFCVLEGKIKGYIPIRPSETQTQHGFDGSEIIFGRNVVGYEEGFLYEKPALVNGKFWGGPPRSDFLIASYLLYQKDNFFNEMKEKVWNSVLKQMIREYGRGIDLEKVNIINTDFTYQKNPERIPLDLIKKIQRETKDRLKKL